MSSHGSTPTAKALCVGAESTLLTSKLRIGVTVQEALPRDYSLGCRIEQVSPGSVEELTWAPGSVSSSWVKRRLARLSGCDTPHLTGQGRSCMCIRGAVRSDRCLTTHLGCHSVPESSSTLKSLPRPEIEPTDVHTLERQTATRSPDRAPHGHTLTGHAPIPRCRPGNRSSPL